MRKLVKPLNNKRRPIDTKCCRRNYCKAIFVADLPENIAFYQQQAASGTFDPLPYDRLMIYYRKQKEYKKELQLINRALKLFGDRLKQQAGQVLKAAKSRTAIKRLSAQLSKSAGLTDKKGNLTFLPEPLSRWTKRKKTVEQKIKKIK